jgi:transcriptional regulator with XRE-family HTH domain
MQPHGLITTVKTAPHHDLVTLAQRLKHARELAHLNQEELAQRAGVSQGTIGNIESGFRLNPRNLIEIAAALGVEARWLKTGLGQREKKPQTAIVSALIAAEPAPLTAPSSDWPFSAGLLRQVRRLDGPQLKRLETTIENRCAELLEDRASSLPAKRHA